LLEHALLYEKEGAWESLYETARELISMKEAGPQFSLVGMEVRALMHLDLGAYALTLAQKAVREFPKEPRVSDTLAALWYAFGAYEEALFALARPEAPLDPPLTAELLSRTGRWVEARQFRKVHGMPDDPPAAGRKQALLPPRAECAVTPLWGAPLTAREMDEEAREMERDARAATSPFIRGIRQRMADWFRNAGKGTCSRPETWAAVGRDDQEKGAALNELALLLARQGRNGEAAGVLAQATALIPECPVPWRVWVALTDGNAEVVAKARRACPSDPELWLASLVARTRDEGPGTWSLAEVDMAVAGKEFSPGTLVRAGDFLLRKSMKAAAAKAADARHAATARINCALMVRLLLRPM
jgi:Flp pilus assembly protein TadD